MSVCTVEWEWGCRRGRRRRKWRRRRRRRGIAEILLFAIIEHEQKRHELQRNEHTRITTPQKTVLLTTGHYSCIQFVRYNFFTFRICLPYIIFGLLPSSLPHWLCLPLIVKSIEKKYSAVVQNFVARTSYICVCVHHSWRWAFNSISARCSVYSNFVCDQ